jgi:hypothetical protein
MISIDGNALGKNVFEYWEIANHLEASENEPEFSGKLDTQK